MKPYSSRELVLQLFAGKKINLVLNFDLLRNRQAVEFYAGKPLTGQKEDWTVVGAACQRVLDMTRTLRVPTLQPYQREENGFTILYTGWTSWILRKPFSDYRSFINWVKEDVTQVGNETVPEELIENTKKDWEWKRSLLGDTVLLWHEPEGWFYTLYNKAGLENFIYLSYDDPLLFSEWIEVHFQHKLRMVKALADPSTTPIAFIGEDIAHKTGLIFSPHLLEKEFFPRLKTLCEVLHQRGVKVIFHSDGNLWEVLDMLMACEIDALNPLEPEAGMDLEKVRLACPDRVILIGNLDCSYLLPFGEERDIEREIKRIVGVARESGRVIFASSSELHDGIPLEKIQFMFETFQKHRLIP